MPEPVLRDEYYKTNSDYTELFANQQLLYRGFAQKLLSAIKERALNSSSLLDVGCGGGFLVEVATEMGFEAEGIEENVELVRWCKHRGIKVSNTRLSDLSAGGEKKFDVIVFSAVLEHLQRPEKALLECKKLLNPDGIVLISQASYDGLLPSVFPWGWYGWQPHEHYWHFTPNSLRQMAQQAGFREVFCIRDSLHHAWFLSGELKILIGRNLAAVLARIGARIGRGDSFNMILTFAPALEKFGEVA